MQSQKRGGTNMVKARPNTRLSLPVARWRGRCSTVPVGRGVVRRHTVQFGA